MNNPERLHSNQYDEGINAFESMAEDLRIGQDKEPERDPVAKALSECLKEAKAAVGCAGGSFGSLKKISIYGFYDAVKECAKKDNTPDVSIGATVTPGKIAAIAASGITTGILSAAGILAIMNALGLADDPDINGGIFEAAFFSGLFIPYGISEYIEKVKNGEAEPLGDSLAHFFNNLVNRGRN